MSFRNTQGSNMSKRVTLGSLPGWNDAIVPIPEKGTEAVTVNYNINATTFLEGTYGRAGKPAGRAAAGSRE